MIRAALTAPSRKTLKRYALPLTDGGILRIMQTYFCCIGGNGKEDAAGSWEDRAAFVVAGCCSPTVTGGLEKNLISFKLEDCRVQTGEATMRTEQALQKTTLWALPHGDLSPAEQALALSLQGLVNRTVRPRL